MIVLLTLEVHEVASEGQEDKIGLTEYTSLILKVALQ